ncbi:MAG: efflux RND transporter periplasmic adaptor subunit [Thermoanaerobaculia bacterium]
MSSKLSLPCALLACVLWNGCDRAPATPTARALRGDFLRAVEVEGFLKAAKSTPLTAPTGADSAMRVSWLAEDGAHVAAGDVVARFDETEWTKALAEAEGKRGGVGLRMEKQRIAASGAESGAELDSDLARRELEMAERFQVSDSSFTSRNEMVESALDAGLARSRDLHARGVRDVQRRVAAGESALLAIEDRQAGEEIAHARSGLTALSLAAPHDGLVVFLRDWRGNTTRVGDSIWPGQRMAEIPDLSEMECEVYVLEADAGGLAIGQKATVRLEAHPEVEFAGQVKRVDAVAKPRFRGVPVQFFGATIQLARTDADLMKPGQRVRARIEIDRRSDVLLIPAAAVLSREGHSFVQRRGSAGFELVSVEIAASDGGRVVVTSGLSAGDDVALAAPESGGSGGETDTAPAAGSPGAPDAGRKPAPAGGAP